MKRFLIIECDTEFSSVFVREVTQSFTETVNYHHEPGAPILICDLPSPKFYGKLDALLVTRGKVEDAKPIVPERPAAVAVASVSAAPFIATVIDSSGVETTTEMVGRVQGDPTAAEWEDGSPAPTDADAEAQRETQAALAGEIARFRAEVERG